MNEISAADAENEIGTPGWKGLDRLAIHLGDGFKDTIRIAQSIITRSESALFGLSMPRFAVRRYLKQGGFLNCRRLATLTRMFSIDNNMEWGNRYGNDDVKPEERNRDLEDFQAQHIPIAQVMAGQNCIADSLLPEPRRLSRFRFYYVDISRAYLFESYGESEKDFYCSLRAFLPYTRTMNLGGGLCGQGVSFMATAVLAAHSNGVHGIAEITALAHSAECRELSLGSLDPEGMDRYFQQVNLRLAEQCLTQEPCHKILPGREKHFSAAIRSYLRSGMPVIFPTNTKQLSCLPSTLHSVYSKNGLFIKGVDKMPDEPHVVLIVGANDQEGHFVFHDTATMPFMVATTHELCFLGAPRMTSTKVADNGVIMPVVPKPVHMPLLDERIYILDEDNNQRLSITGLRFGLQLLTSLYHFHSDYPCRAQAALFMERFSLVRSDNPMLSLGQSPNEYHTLLESGLLRAMSILEQRRSWNRPHWLWIEAFPNSLWVWDAEITPPSSLPDTRDGWISLVGNGYLLSTVHVESRDRGAELSFFSPQ